MGKIVFITPGDAEYGFSLAGVMHHVADYTDAEDALEDVIRQTGPGIVIIDERLLRAVSEDALRDAEKKWSGIVLVLPSPERPEAEAEDYAARLIRQAVGYHVRLKL